MEICAKIIEKFFEGFEWYQIPSKSCPGKYHKVGLNPKTGKMICDCERNKFGEICGHIKELQERLERDEKYGKDFQGICDGCEKLFPANQLFKSKDGNYYCFGCAKRKLVEGKTAVNSQS